MKAIIPDENMRKRIWDVNPNTTWTGKATHINIPEDIYVAHHEELKAAFPNHHIVPYVQGAPE